MAETARLVVLVSSVERPTISTVLVPVPTGCDQLAEAALVTAFVAALSKAMAARAEVTGTVRVKNAATSAQARRSVKRRDGGYMGVWGVERTLTRTETQGQNALGVTFWLCRNRALQVKIVSGDGRKFRQK